MSAMSKEESAVAIVSALIITVGTYLIGRVDLWLTALFVVGVMDWIAGSVHGCSAVGGWSAGTNFRGVTRKLGILMVLVLCHQIDMVTAEAGNPGALRFLGSVWYLGHDGMSLLKNLKLMGVEIFPGVEAALSEIGRRGKGPPADPGGGTDK